MKKFLLIILIIAIWQLFYLAFPFQNHLIPSPFEISQSFIEGISDGVIVSHSLASIKRVLIGFLIASIVGIFSALFLGYYQKIGDYFNPLIEILRPIPPIAWIPIAILIFGLGDGSSYFIVALGAFFPIFTNTYFGIISLPKIYKNVADSFEIKKYIFVKNILFPFSLPYIFIGLKIGMGMAWMSVIAAELIGAQSGLGYFIQLNRLLLRTDNILVGMISIGLIGYALTKALSLAEDVAMPWKKK